MTKKRHGPLTYALLFLLCGLGGCSSLGERVSRKNDNYYYSIDRKSIIYCRMGNWFELGKQPMNADAQSFQVLDDLYWSKDKDNIYYENIPLDYLNIDLESFQVQDFFWATDKNHVYTKVSFMDDNYDDKVIIIKNADPASYSPISSTNWAKDASHFFFEHHLAKVDYATFQILTDQFVRDKDHLYVIPLHQKENEHVTFQTIDVDPSKIQVINEQYIKDENHLYYFSYNYQQEKDMKVYTIPYESYDDVHFYDDSYIKVGEKIYYDAHELINVDVPTFRALELGHMADKNALYIAGKRIDGVDFESLAIPEGKFYYQDKHYRYNYEGKEPVDSTH